MATEVLYVEAQVSIFYHHTDVLALDQNQIADVVAGLYLPPVRYDPPGGEPTLMIISENGNSQIVVTSSSVALHVTFSPQWQRESERGRVYIEERMPLLLGVISPLRAKSLIYAGATVQSQAVGNLSDLEIIRTVEAIYGGRFGANLTDLLVRTSEVVDNDYYRNVTIRNFRSFVAGPQTPPQIRLKNDTASTRGIAMTADFNSRYGYNEGRNMPVTLESVHEIIAGAYSTTAELSRRVLERMK